MRERHAWFWHPPHRWRGVHVDRSRLWPVVTLGWWTVEVLPPPIARRLLDVLAAMRGKPGDDT